MKDLERLIMLGVVKAGTYHPDLVLPHIEAVLTPKEFKTVQDFLLWVHVSNKTFGWGNIGLVMKEWSGK